MKKQLLFLTVSAFALFSCSNDDDAAPAAVAPLAEGTIIASTGGPNQQNQLYIDLSSDTKTAVQRDTWDLAFSSGNSFRVAINGANKMAVKQLNTTNINEVQSEDASVSVGFSTFASMGYVDNPTGILEGNGGGFGTAIAEVSSVDADNKVYLVNLGFNVGTTTPNVGSVATDGAARGWKKIRVTRSGSNYVLQYADLNATTHNTITVSKNAAYNFSFVNLLTGQQVNVEPKKDRWDLNFTTFTNYFPFAGGEITYFFADFITTNFRGGTRVYQVLNSEANYDTFTLASVIEASFNTSATDQRVIGSGWRNGGGPTSGPSIRDDRFYILKDTDGNIYKIKFLALTNDAGVRGFSVFQFELLQ